MFVPGFDLEQLGHQMRADADGGAVVQLAGIGLGVCHQFLDRLHLQRRAGDQHALVDHRGGDRRERFLRIVVELVEQRLAAEGPDRAHQQRVAVGRGVRDQLGPDGAAGAALVLDDDGLPEARLQPLRNQPGGGVGCAARGKRHHELDRPLGIALRLDGVRRAGAQRDRQHRQDSKSALRSPAGSRVSLYA